MKVTLTDYRLGVVVGALFAFGFQNVFEGVEVLVFDGLLIPWNTQYALMAVALGFLLIGLSFTVNRWAAAAKEVADLEVQD